VNSDQERESRATKHNNKTQQHNTTTQHNNTTTQHNNTTQQHNTTTQHNNTTQQHNSITLVGSNTESFGSWCADADLRTDVGNYNINKNKQVFAFGNIQILPHRIACC
jgi:glutamate synthase domain-containing protein 3